MEQFLSNFTDHHLAKALKTGKLQFDMGTIKFTVKTSYRNIIPFLRNQYHHVPVCIEEKLSHFTLQLQAPTKLRQYFRRQVVPVNTGFQGLMPLPLHLAPLSLEMGLNLHTALGTYRHLILHAGAVANSKGEAILMPAGSGSGKSTMTAFLMENNYRLLSDEFGIIDMKSGLLKPFPRPVSLKNASIDVVKSFTESDQFSDRFYKTPKGTLAYRRPRQMDLEGRTLDAGCKYILFPKFKVNAPSGGQLKELRTSESILKMIPGSTNYKALGRSGFDALSSVAEQATCYSLEYNSLEDCQSLLRQIGVLS
ncbi:HprK-related kinase A [Temperatibacter marinus]|uniref:HprK-related kinase A n=1 Tax=Temperatibacter marinus TaxID=1456591 RepID=A0AA52EHV3_9PROT|nr:HprK-related kinase A [Temperatibacter marinus]WND02594.1 HprK-related kinase A [Temperatibacter marinus]